MWAHEHGPDQVTSRLRALSQTLHSYLKLVVIDLAPEDNAQVIFETLNHRGVELLAADLIKDLIFQVADRQRHDLRGLYHDRIFTVFRDNVVKAAQPDMVELVSDLAADAAVNASFETLPPEASRAASTTGSLPLSARNHLPHWYGYEGSALGRAIRDAGWKASSVNLTSERLTFVRDAGVPSQCWEHPSEPTLPDSL